MNKFVSIIIFTIITGGQVINCTGVAQAFEIGRSPLELSVVDRTLDSSYNEVNLDRELDRNLTLKTNIQTRLNKEQQDSQLLRLIVAGLILGLGIVGWRFSRRGKRIHGKISWGDRVLIDRISPRLRRKLLRLINDPKTANRLLMGTYERHRDRPPDWVAEKVIYDLQRGR